LANAYWVQPGRLLAGEYPGAEEDDEATADRVARLLEAGIDTFVDLTVEGEREPYHALLGPAVEHHRLPIVDHGLPRSPAHMRDILGLIDDALARGRSVYLHCRAGIGRTGMVVACHLAATGRGGEEALAELNRLWRQSARSAQWKRVPETDEQRDFVVEFAESLADTELLLDADALSAARRLRERFHGALFGLAAGDALAAPTQLGRAGAFAPVRDMLGGGPYDLPRGAWSDDTAMALCLGQSLVGARGFDARDQLERYARWQREGEPSATGQCVGITGSVAKALGAARWRRQVYAGSHDPSLLEPDPLVRAAPAAMFFFADAGKAVQQAAEAARITCQAPGVLAATRLFAAMLHAALSGAPRDAVLSPAESLWRRADVPPRLAAIAAGSFRGRTPETLNPGGDALDLLEAALWAFDRHASWREGALAAVNLGGHADVIGALHGQLAGAHHGLAAIPLAWREALARRELIEDLADQLLADAIVGLGES
jgi:ADP-ribosyl-[dinitrogen reductase] hydrolase